MKQEDKTDKRTKKRKIGDIGENIACRFLMKRGFEIIEQNYNKKWGEIDIISKKGEKLHFIEVKSVSRDSLKYVSPETDSYRPEDNLHPWKLERLSRVIQTYLLGYKGNRSVSFQPGNSTGETDWQFDVIVVYLDMKGLQAKINYMEDIII
jgi:putative endonuclease